MILVDTSVWVDYLKGRDNASVRAFDHVLNSQIPYGICEFVYQELLQGARSAKEFQTLKAYLETIPFYPLRRGRESFEQAAQMHMRCRERGITIRSTIDLLIAQIAIENDLRLLHNDRDFDNLAKAMPDLRIYGG